MTPPSLSINPFHWHFDNSYLQLPDTFYSRQNPVPVLEPKLTILNSALAESLGLNAVALNTDDGTAIFSGNKIAPGSEPLAQAYTGHQFGHFTMLGDGRAILLGEHLTPKQERFDIQLKGSGRTPFSRGGDGRATLGPMLREYIISEAMHALGIPTTRSLAVVTTGEVVYREQDLPGAVLTRVASSHIRVGTFQYAAARGEINDLRALADYTLKRHYPERLQDENPYYALLGSVMERQASLIAKWQLAGFVHGVMNTDNMTLCGETIDYGPCAFMDTYHPATVFSSIDTHGRYAYANQPVIGQWNLARLAETLLPLLDDDKEKALQLGQNAIESFPERYERYWHSGMRQKLGLLNEEADDAALLQDLLSWMQEAHADYTHTFYALSTGKITEEPCFQEEAFQVWHAQWQARLSRQNDSLDAVRNQMLAANPSIIPRNHRVEEALSAAVRDNNLSVLHQLLDAIQNPYSTSSDYEKYRTPPETNGVPYRTFCGT